MTNDFVFSSEVLRKQDHGALSNGILLHIKTQFLTWEVCVHCHLHI